MSFGVCAGRVCRLVVVILLPLRALAYEALQEVEVTGAPMPASQLSEAAPDGAGAVADSGLQETLPAVTHSADAERASRENTAVSERAQSVREAANNRLSLMSHKTNYVLPFAYSPERNSSDIDSVDGAPHPYQRAEVEFQLSVQVPLWEGILGADSFLSLAYTNHSFWQAYTPSAPFRETVHEPELLMTWLSDWSLLGFRCIASQVGLNHQSNGRAGELSRGWNRLYSRFIFERGAYHFSFKPWYRFTESRVGDDNRDIEFYLGHFELAGGYNGEHYSASLMVRNNLESSNRGAVELRWSFPLTQRVRGFVKYFNGYGESLINYDRSVQSLGIGIELAEGF